MRILLLLEIKRIKILNMELSNVYQLSYKNLIEKLNICLKFKLVFKVQEITVTWLAALVLSLIRKIKAKTR